jgi:hypothetical protein
VVDEAVEGAVHTGFAIIEIDGGGRIPHTLTSSVNNHVHVRKYSLSAIAMH